MRKGSLLLYLVGALNWKQAYRVNAVCQGWWAVAAVQASFP